MVQQEPQGSAESDEVRGSEGRAVGGGRQGTPGDEAGQWSLCKGEEGEGVKEGEADLFKVSWVKSPLGHKKRDSPIGQSQLAAFTADACIGETVRFKAWGKILHLLFSIYIDSQRLVFLLIAEMS